MALQIDSSGILLLQQVGSDVQYSTDDGTNWLDISGGQWPVTLNNTYTANTLEVTFTTDLSLNTADQYFIIDSSNITIDGSNNTVNIDISGAGYPGLVRNGTYSYSGGNITANNNAYSDITIQNIIIDSHSSSLLAIAPTTSTQYNDVKYGNGWLCQAYFGLDGSTNSIDNCSSNGGTGTVYWVASNGDVSNNNNASTQGGCILGDFCSADVTNCYSTGDSAGGIFGSYGRGSATNCYSTGDNAGGIFGSDSSGSATNCYSTGDIDSNAGGIFGSNSQGSATNCYSTGDIGLSSAGGIFGSNSRGSASNCYSIGDINDFGGGIFGPNSQGSATNCYSTGRLPMTGGGIFGSGSQGSATNCYCTCGTNIGVTDVSYCYAINGSINWSDASANAALDVSGNYTDIDLNSTNVPYLLSAFTSTLYSPSSATDALNSGISILTDCSFSIVSVNGLNPLDYPGINIDENTGDISFNSLPYGIIYEVNVLATNTNDGYSFGTFTNSLPTTIDASGTVDLRQNGSITQYSNDGGVTWTDAVWPVTLINDGTGAPGARALAGLPLTITFTSDLSFNSVDQYFIIDSSNITIDGSNHIVYVDVSSNDYPGLVQNGAFGASGYSFITIQNLGIESTYTVALSGGWVGQQYFGKDASDNYVENCYSTGPIGTEAGGIFGSFSQATATNCYSIGTINTGAGGIFGPNSQPSASANNCYSTGPIITLGTNGGGGIFGYGSQGSATNCYSIGPIGGNNAGGIFGSGSPGSATNCYSTGPIGLSAGGIFGFNSPPSASATNCYSTGSITGGEGIGANIDVSYCYFTDGSTNWLDSAADASLNVIEPNVWTDIDTNSENVPYRLTSFYINQILYDPSSGTNVVTEYPVPDVSGIYTWSITSVNGSTTNNEGITIDGSNGDISFGVSSNGTYAVNVLAEDSFGKYSFETFTNIISNICFPAGTPIVTNQGIIPINKINPKIHTIRNKKIVAITKTVSPDKYLVRFEKDALGTNLPCEATTMTKNHMLLYKGKMMKADEFLKTHNESVSKVPYNGQVLYNVLLEEHDKMVVNNLICETLHPENYVAKMYRAFKTLTPKQRVEMIKQVNKAVLTNDIYNKPTSKKFTFTVSK
jgi:hypothetical protein